MTSKNQKLHRMTHFMQSGYQLLALVLSTVQVNAHDFTEGVAIGGGPGGAVGAVVGKEVEGRDCVITGGAIGGQPVQRYL